MAILNKKIQLMGIALIFVAAALVLASAESVQNYESAVTARIVGNSPGDMQNQLTDDYINLEKASFIGSVTSPIYRILRDIFKGNVDTPWDWMSSLESSLNTDKGKLLVMNPISQKKSMKEIYFLNVDNADRILDELDRSNNLVLLNSPYSGLYVPADSSLVGKISPHANVIAPTSYSSEAFLKAFLCNVGIYDTLGEDYRQARNNYYWNTRDKTELIGLTLISYGFYGMPTRALSTPDLASSYCDDYHEDFSVFSAAGINLKPSNAKDSGLTVSSTEDGTEVTKTYKFEIKDYSVDSIENTTYSVIDTDQTTNSLDAFELVLPRRVLSEEFPYKTIITGVNLIGMSNAEDITVENLPMRDFETYVDRECYYENQSAGIGFSHTYTGESIIALTTIDPVEVVNCSAGKFRLYKTLQFNMTFVTNSPVLIEGIDALSETIPNKTMNVKVSLANLKANPVQGELRILDSDGAVISSQQITANTGVYTFSINSPEKEGLYNYKVEFYYNGESVTFKKFSFAVNVIDSVLLVPLIVTSPTTEVNLVVTNKLQNSLETSIYYKLSQNGQNKSEKLLTETLKPGINVIPITVEGLERDKILYDLFTGISYLQDYKIATGNIITEHAPVIVQSNIYLKENETVLINPEVYDIDGDTLAITSDSRFANGTITGFDDSGVYDVTLTVNDGIKTASRTMKLFIENVNRAPTISLSSDKVTLHEGETMSLAPNVSDPDNENSVTNDDNLLGVSYSSLFNENGTLASDFEDSGNYTVYVSVSDGNFSDFKEVQVEILNTNRAPVINASTITVRENALVNVTELLGIYDPDNNNSVTNDDNNLTISYGELINETGLLQTDYDDAGDYTFNVSVSDGALTTQREISLKVTNVNRAPTISAATAKTSYVISKNKNVTLNVSASDPDSDSVTVSWYVGGNKVGQGNTYTFAANGISGTYTVTATASDNDLSNSTQFTVQALDVPILTGFDGSTSSFTAGQNINSVDLTLEKTSYGKISFNSKLNLTETLDISDGVLIRDNYISLNSAAYPSLNVPARITFYNVQSNNPIIYYDGGFSVSDSSISTVCPSSICTNIVKSGTTLSFDAAHFSTFSTKQGSGNQFGFTVSPSVTIEVAPDSSAVSSNLEVRNTGLADLSNVIVSGSFASGNSLTITPSTFSIASGGSKTIEIRGTIAMPSNYSSQKIGTLTFEETSLKQTTDVYLKKKEPLSIEGIKIKIGSTEYDVSDGSEITLKKGEDMKLTVSVRNLLSTEIRDIELTANARGLAQRTFDKFNLNSGQSKQNEATFDIPSIFDESSYTLELKALSKNAPISDFEKIVRINLKTSKKGHEILLNNLVVDPAAIDCSGEIRVSVDMVNSGTSDENNAKLKIENSNLKLSSEYGFSLSSGETKPYSSTLNVKSNEALSGSYTLSIKAISSSGNILGETSKVVEYSCSPEVVQVQSVSNDKISLGSKESNASSTLEDDTIIYILIGAGVVFAVIMLIVLMFVLTSRPRPRLQIYRPNPNYNSSNDPNSLY